MITIESGTEQAALLKGSIAHNETVQCKNRLAECIERFAGKDLHLDLSGLESVSSIALSFLLSGLRSAKEVKCDLHYKNMPSALFNMARVSGIESILIDKSHSD